METFFTDATLQELINNAIDNNYDMQVAVKNMEAAQLIVKQSKLNYLPDATLQVSASINRPSDNSLNGLSLSKFVGRSYVEDYSASVALIWEADIWGKIKNQKRNRTGNLPANNRSQESHPDQPGGRCCTWLLQFAHAGCTNSHC